MKKVLKIFIELSIKKMLEEHFKKQKRGDFSHEQTLITCLLLQQNLLLNQHQVQNQQDQVIALDDQKVVYHGHNHPKNEIGYNKNLVDENNLRHLGLLDESKYHMLLR